MARFIPIDKMKQLREAAKSGDERALKILHAQLDGCDFGADLDEYFKPAPKPEPVPEMRKEAEGVVSATTEQAAGHENGNEKLEAFLKSNGIGKDSPEYNDYVNDYYMEFPNERPAEEPEHEQEIDLTKGIAQGIINVISICDRTSLEILQDSNIDGTAKKGAMTIIQEIKTSLLDAAEKLTKIKTTLEDKKENEMGVALNGQQ